MNEPSTEPEEVEPDAVVYAPPEPFGEWFARGARKWSTYALPVAHVAGGVLAGATLARALQFRLLLEILWGRLLILGQFRILWLVVPLALVCIVLLAVVESVRSTRRIVTRQHDPDGVVKVRVLAVFALGCVVFNAFVLSTPETFAGPFRVRFPIIAEMSAAFAYGAFALWSLLLPRIRKVTPSGVRRAIDVLCMNALVLLLLVEMSLTALAHVGASPLLVTESSPPSIRRDSERLQPGQLLFGFPINAGGHHDTEFLPREARSRRTVVGIGDSFSYGVVPHRFHYTTVAERLGNGFEIYNMGYPGIGPSDYLYLLENDALELEPDLVLINVFVGNDIADNPSPAGPARWYDADSYLTAVVWYRLQILRRADRVDFSTGAGGAVVDTTAFDESLPWLADPLGEPPSIAREIYLQLELQNALSVATMDEGVYARFITFVRAMSLAAGEVPVVFALIPDEFQVEDDLWDELVAMSDVPLDRDGPQRKLLEEFERLGLPALDLLPPLRAAEPLADGRQHVYHNQNMHFNARGNEIAGRELASFVDSLLALPPEMLRPAVLPPPPVRALPHSLDFLGNEARTWMTGWYPAEDGGGRMLSWSSGQQSALAMDLPTDEDLRLTFEVLPFEFDGSPPQSITVVINDVEIGQVSLASGLQSYSLDIPASALSTVPQTFEFRYAWSRNVGEVIPGSADVRELAVAWYSAEFSSRSP